MADAVDPFAHSARRSWRRVRVDVPAELAEAAADLLAEVSGAGMEVIPSRHGAGDAPREQVVGYLAADGSDAAAEARLRRGLAALARHNGGAAVIVRASLLLEEDWGADWKAHFRPFHATPRLVIKPTWEGWEARAGEAVVEMDPGLAFGTGLHASTRLALGFVEDLCAAAPTRRALDLGTGTGLLAIAAALWGTAHVVAVDNDADAVAAARGNVARNGLAKRVRVGGEALADLHGRFDLIAANITADVLLGLAGGIVAHLEPGGALVLAGILAGGQAREVREGFERLGLSCVAERTAGEWTALLLQFPVPGQGGP
jgi:ribosomal protein L11 methyltransferase